MDPTTAPHQKGWFGRNWFWVVPTGCLLPLIVCGGCLGIFFVGITEVLRASDPYQEALAAAQANEQVKEALGEPIEPSTFVTGSVNVVNDSGEATLLIPIAGPKGKGVIHVEAKKKVGVWEYTTLKVLSEQLKLPVDLAPPKRS